MRSRLPFALDLASAVDAAFFAAVCAAFGLAVALAWDAAAHGPHSLLRARTSPPPAVSTRESAFRFAGWGEAAGDSLNAPQETDQTMNADEITADFLDALARLESGNQPTAVNRREDAHGLYQIRPAYLADANRIMGTNYTLADCHRPAVAEEVVRAYLAHYGTAWERRCGRRASPYELARIHNGGPRGAERNATIDYGARFLALWEGGAK